MIFLYVLAAVVAIPLAIGAVNEVARRGRRRAARLTVLPLFLLAACDDPGGLLVIEDSGAGGSATTSTALPCPPAPLFCPASPVTECPVNAVPTTCCADGAPAIACEVPAGLLTTACPDTCKSGLCAVSRHDVVTCCAPPSLFPDPCFVAQPDAGPDGG